MGNNQRDFSFSVCCGYGLAREELLGVIWRELGQRLIVGLGNNLDWGFLLLQPVAGYLGLTGIP